MAVSGPSCRHGWIPRVRVITKNGLDLFGNILGICFRTCCCRDTVSIVKVQGWVRIMGVAKVKGKVAVVPTHVNVVWLCPNSRRTSEKFVMSSDKGGCVLAMRGARA